MVIESLVNGTVIITDPNTSNLVYATWAIAFVTIVSIIVTTLLTRQSLIETKRSNEETIKVHNEESKIRYVQLLTEFDKDLTERMVRLSQIKTSDDAIGYVTDILNALDRMTHLYHTKNITFETIDYFSEIYRFGLALREWVVDIGTMTRDEVLSSWSEFNEFCGREGILAVSVEELPTSLLNIDELTEEEQVRKSMNGIKKEIDDLSERLSKIKKQSKKRK